MHQELIASKLGYMCTLGSLPVGCLATAFAVYAYMHDICRGCPCQIGFQIQYKYGMLGLQFCRRAGMLFAVFFMVCAIVAHMLAPECLGCEACSTRLCYNHRLKVCAFFLVSVQLTLSTCAVESKMQICRSCSANAIPRAFRLS